MPNFSLVLASNNAKKSAELNALLSPLGWHVRPQSELGVSEAPEPYDTFIENALSKARHAAQCTGLPALADDSGLCVHALGGAPGIHSARFAGEPKSDARNNARLLEKLQGIDDRQAFFCCTLVLIRHAKDPCPLIAQGQWHGEILQESRGEHGFGYDPLFWLPEHQQTAAELDPVIKNQQSHRARAIQALLAQLRMQTSAP